jgi:hypothetical protein
MGQSSVASSRPLGRPSTGLRWCESFSPLPKRLESGLTTKIRFNPHDPHPALPPSPVPTGEGLGSATFSPGRRKPGEGEPSAASGGYVGVANTTVSSVSESPYVVSYFIVKSASLLRLLQAAGGAGNESLISVCQRTSGTRYLLGLSVLTSAATRGRGGCVLNIPGLLILSGLKGNK